LSAFRNGGVASQKIEETLPPPTHTHIVFYCWGVKPSEIQNRMSAAGSNISNLDSAKPMETDGETDMSKGLNISDCRICLTWTCARALELDGEPDKSDGLDMFDQ
jgi:hypothetical protein